MAERKENENPRTGSKLTRLAFVQADTRRDIRLLTDSIDAQTESLRRAIVTTIQKRTDGES